ncbi:MAG: gliding motility-associated C-terminal domain-containing protein [Saprospiraceae bacterium]|nr:gliding motility-associated C-terminal domain-containing protein [Saprospiraceae bacterium]
MNQNIKKIQEKILHILIFCSIGFSQISGQVLNDDCQFAKALPSTDNFCSADGAFTNVGAKPDTEFNQGTADCISLKWANGVWFSFVPREPAILIRVLGLGNGGTMRSPKIILFEKCGKYLTCSPGKDVGVDELVFDDLNIGQVYFIMVESSTDGPGTFKICLDDFIPVKSPESDCKDGVVLCDKSSFKVNDLQGNGNNQNELEKDICVGGEFASAWYKWTCDVSGSLTFTLTPNNNFLNQITDDIDFALYELPNGLDDCNNKKLLRCEGAGANTDGFGNIRPLSEWSLCNGPTGLRSGESDISEPGGCVGRNNNFVQPIDMVAGKSYVLIINNFSRSGLGFAIEFGGTGTFLGPNPDFEINANKAFECDKSVIYTNKSQSDTDPIIKYSWNFGDRSVPSRATGFGPYNVSYESFGNKTAALTVESSRGCTVTKIVDFFVDACCKDTSTLALNAEIIDLRCYQIPEGQIIAKGVRGAPDYQYSLNGGPFQPSPLFGDLDIGNYTLTVQDIKGCTESLNRIINQPPPIIIDAGMDSEIELGDVFQLNGSYTSFNGADTLYWNPSADFAINGIEDPIVFPKTTTTYTFTVIDTNGCIKEDIVTIRVIKDYKLFTPNIFTPAEGKTNSPFNDFFNVWGTKGVKFIELLEVYDRWGNLVYQGIDVRIPDANGKLETNTDQNGWDGTFKSLPAVAGVYVWRARVRYIDDFVKDYAGDLTLVR